MNTFLSPVSVVKIKIEHEDTTNKCCGKIAKDGIGELKCE